MSSLIFIFIYLGVVVLFAVGMLILSLKNAPLNVFPFERKDEGDELSTPDENTRLIA